MEMKDLEIFNNIKINNNINNLIYLSTKTKKFMLDAAYLTINLAGKNPGLNTLLASYIIRILTNEYFPYIVCIKKDTKINHTSFCKFTDNRKYPFYVYNWYSAGDEGFWTDQDGDWIKYNYKIKKDIPYIIIQDVDDIELNMLETFLKKINTKYIPGFNEYNSDYEAMAVLCQVLGFNGTISGDPKLKVCRDKNHKDYVLKEGSIITLCGTGKRYLRHISTITKENVFIPICNYDDKDPNKFKGFDFDSKHGIVEYSLEEAKKHRQKYEKNKGLSMISFQEKTTETEKIF